MSKHRDDLGALLRLAREAELPSDEGMAQARDAAREVWAATVRRRRRSRRLAAAATVLLAGALAVLLGPDRGWLAEPVAPLAQLEVVRGNVEVRSEVEVAEGTGLEKARPRTRSEWRRESELDVPLQAGTVLETAPGARAALRLQGGSRIRLDATSRLRLAGVGRVDLERGALSFESARLASGADPAVAERDVVQVSTPLGVIVNRGTSYEARLEGDGLVVRVRSGAVAVEPLQGEAVDVHAGEIARVSPGGAVSTEALEPADASSAWTRSLVVPFAIDGRSLGDFLSWVEREGGYETRLGAGVSAQLLQSRLRGDLVWTLPEEALEPTLALLGLRPSYGDGVIVVER